MKLNRSEELLWESKLKRWNHREHCWIFNFLALLFIIDKLITSDIIFGHWSTDDRLILLIFLYTLFLEEKQKYENLQIIGFNFNFEKLPPFELLWSLNFHHHDDDRVVMLCYTLGSSDVRKRRKVTNIKWDFNINLWAERSTATRRSNNINILSLSFLIRRRWSKCA